MSGWIALVLFLLFKWLRAEREARRLAVIVRRQSNYISGELNTGFRYDKELDQFYGSLSWPIGTSDDEAVRLYAKKLKEARAIALLAGGGGEEDREGAQG